MQSELAEGDIFALAHEASQARSAVEDVMDAVSALADMRFEERHCQAVDMMWKMRKSTSADPASLVALSFFNNADWKTKTVPGLESHQECV